MLNPTRSILSRIKPKSTRQALAEEQATQLYEAGVGKFVGTGELKYDAHCTSSRGLYYLDWR